MFLASDTRFDSGKMNVGFEDSTVTIVMNVSFDDQYDHDSYDGLNGQDGYNDHDKRLCSTRVATSMPSTQLLSGG